MAEALKFSPRIPGIDPSGIGFKNNIAGQKKRDGELDDSEKRLKRSEKKLKELESFNQTLINASAIGIASYDAATGKCLSANPALAAIAGTDQETLLKQNFRKIKSWAVSGLLKEAEDTLLTGKIHQAEKHFTTSFRKEIWIDYTFIKFKNKNRIHLLLMMNDITEKRSLEKKLLHQKVQEQKNLTHAIVQAQEKERSEIGKELHDNVNQLLAASKLFLGQGLSQSEYKPFILKSQEYITAAMEELRKLSHALVGSTHNESIGLIESLEQLITNISLVKDINIRLNCDGFDEEKTDAGLRLVIYRIIQEQLNNILKHSEASDVSIEIKKEPVLEINITDNGRGFDVSEKRKGIGLANIVNRARIYNGNVDIHSSPGQGCSMTIIFK